MSVCNDQHRKYLLLYASQNETLIKISVIDAKKCGISEEKIITAKINNSDNSLSKEKIYPDTKLKIPYICTVNEISFSY